MTGISHTYHTKKPKTLEAIIERAATQFLVRIDTFFVQIEGDYLFWRHHFQSYVIGHCKKLSQDFKLMQALALYTAIARF